MDLGAMGRMATHSNTSSLENWCTARPPMNEWPWPDTRLNRHARIARLYRDALFEAAPHACYELDQLMDGFGQHWITGNKPPHINPDEPLTAAEIAQWCDTRINNITNIIATRGIQPVGKRNGRKTYWLRHFDNTPQQHVATR